VHSTEYMLQFLSCISLNDLTSKVIGNGALRQSVHYLVLMFHINYTSICSVLVVLPFVRKL